MKRRKDKIQGKILVEGDPNLVTNNEILVETHKDNTVSLYKRDTSGKLVNISDDGIDEAQEDFTGYTPVYWAKFKLFTEDGQGYPWVVVNEDPFIPTIFYLPDWTYPSKGYLEVYVANEFYKGIDSVRNGDYAFRIHLEELKDKFINEDLLLGTMGVKFLGGILVQITLNKEGIKIEPVPQGSSVYIKNHQNRPRFHCGISVMNNTVYSYTYTQNAALESRSFPKSRYIQAWSIQHIVGDVTNRLLQYGKPFCMPGSSPSNPINDERWKNALFLGSEKQPHSIRITRNDS